ncbi:mechanosensitive ion channel family protein [Ciceribacter sp. L1K23]|nr:mechanosensitive ion channel family protein [Ciceribacter sp. L1K23]
MRCKTGGGEDQRLLSFVPNCPYFPRSCREHRQGPILILIFQRLLLLRVILAACLVCGSFTVTPVLAQAPAAPAQLEQAGKSIETASQRLNSLEGQIEGRSNNDAALTEIKAQIDSIVRDLLKISVDLRPRFNEVKSRLTELGEPPAEGEPAEAPEITDERNRLNAERLQINALTGQAEDLSIRGTTLSNSVTEIRRQLFAAELFKHTDISADVFAEASGTFVQEADRFGRVVSSWYSFVWKFKRAALGAAVTLSLVLALALAFSEYRLFGNLIRRSRTRDNPSYMSRLSVAFWSTILPTLALGVFLISSYFFLDVFNVLRADIAPIVQALFGFVGLVVFVSLLATAVLAPREPDWRLVRLSNKGARDLNFAVLMMAVINGLDYVVGSATEALSSPIVLTVVKSLISSVLVGLIIFIVSFLRPVTDASGDPALRGRPWPRTLAISFRLVGLGLILAALTGYVGFARFMATQIVVTGAVLVTVYLGILSGKAISAPNRFGETLVGRRLGQRFALSPVALDQTGLAAGLLIYAFAIAIGLPLILFSWGFSPRDLQLLAYQAFTEISIGSIRISLVGIFGGILLFVLGLLATRWFQKWLDGSVMARSHVDGGVRNSVRTAVGYLGTALAGLIGISAAGIDLSSLALVAGALSLGIGFGLQNIVSNFVSGLILLAERPFKVGDWVATGTTEGFVRRISVRATEIETFQRQSIIVPNSELINASVGNWTHRNRLARIDVVVGAGYDSDPRKVMELLQQAALEQEGVLLTPEPFVIFLGFGASSLDFQVCLFVPDILDSLAVKNGVRISILEKFRAEGIEIPYQKHDVNLFVREVVQTELGRATGAKLPDGDHGQLQDRPEADTVTRD